MLTALGENFIFGKKCSPKAVSMAPDSSLAKQPGA